MDDEFTPLTCIGTDSKYGRVFVENPPQSVIGDDEPLFVLRGTDPATPLTILSYAENADNKGSAKEFFDKVNSRIVEIAKWQRKNRERLKVAD